MSPRRGISGNHDRRQSTHGAVNRPEGCRVVIVGAAVRIGDVVLLGRDTCEAAGTDRQRNQSAQANGGTSGRQDIRTDMVGQACQLQQREGTFKGTRPGDHGLRSVAEGECKDQVCGADPISGQPSRAEIGCVSPGSLEQRNHRAGNWLTDEGSCPSAHHLDRVAQVELKKALGCGGAADVAGANRQDAEAGRRSMEAISHPLRLQTMTSVPSSRCVA